MSAALTGPRYADVARRLMISPAHAASSVGRRRTAGEDLAAARRVGHAGDLERPAHREFAQVRQRGDAEARADLRVGERVIDRRASGRPARRVEALHERRRDALRAGLDADARRRDVHAVRIRLAHPRVDVEHRGAIAVDRHFDLLALDACCRTAGRSGSSAAACGSCIRRRPGRCASRRCRRACRTARPRRAASASRCAAPCRWPPTAPAFGSPTASELMRLAARR